MCLDRAKRFFFFLGAAKYTQGKHDCRRSTITSYVCEFVLPCVVFLVGKSAAGNRKQKKLFCSCGVKKERGKK